MNIKILGLLIGTEGMLCVYAAGPSRAAPQQIAFSWQLVLSHTYVYVPSMKSVHPRYMQSMIVCHWPREP